MIGSAVAVSILCNKRVYADIIIFFAFVNILGKGNEIFPHAPISASRAVLCGTFGMTVLRMLKTEEAVFDDSVKKNRTDTVVLRNQRPGHGGPVMTCFF